MDQHKGCLHLRKGVGCLEEGGGGGISIESEYVIYFQAGSIFDRARTRTVHIVCAGLLSAHLSS